MIITDFQVEIARSFSRTIQLRQFEPAQFFMSAKASAPFSQAEELSGMLYELCHDTVQADIEAECSRMGINPPKDIQVERGDSSNRAFADKARELNAGKSPFVVSAATEPPPTTSRSDTASASVPPSSQAPQTPAVSPKASAVASDQPPAGGASAGASPAKRPQGRPKTKKDSPEVASAEGDAATGSGGRPMLQAPKAEGQATPQPTSNVLPFRATAEDVPEFVGGSWAETQARLKAASEPPPIIPQVELIHRVIDGLSKQPRDSGPWKANKLKVLEFLRSFFGTDKLTILPQKTEDEPLQPEYARAIPVLSAMAKLYPTNILSDPSKSGIECASGYKQLASHVAEWRPDLKALAIKAALANYPDMPSDLIEFMASGTPIEGHGNQIVFLQLMCRSREIAAKARMYAQANKLHLSELFEGLELSTCPEAHILSCMG